MYSTVLYKPHSKQVSRFLEDDWTPIIKAAVKLTDVCVCK